MRVLMAAWALALLAGCAVDVLDYKDNRFAEIHPSAARAELVGTWTASIGPYLSTLRIDEDGTGLFCSSWHTHDSLGKIKLVDDVVYFQDGMTMHLSRDGDMLIGQYKQVGMDPARFIPDPTLNEASPYCAAEL